MVRNFVFGCLSATLVILVLVGVLGYFFVWVPIQNFLANFNVPNVAVGQRQPGVPSTPQSVRSAVSLTGEEVRDFVRIRRSVGQAVGQDLGQFQNLYQDFANGQTPSALEVWNVIRNAGGVIGQARTAQEAALRRENMTQAQYANVRTEVNRVLGLPEVDLGVAAQSLQNLQLPNWDQVVVPPLPANKRLIDPFVNELRPTAALGLLGL
ncbi:hypothetical protein [Deinococcus yavapaiensis]|uniref:Uncharacterized protein n=1 Tax=Deinococcus yavapaiensis KR-236 TaxID=694435 RepID=A0A318SJW2_9DEIO|nr:hypothetical protein [Deinococcus yavapaiensis]PYE52848.1 hypothetical protein DES52_11118 [Deinococcus yavapaiensis KR-236]